MGYLVIGSNLVVRDDQGIEVALLEEVLGEEGTHPLLPEF